MHVTIQDIATAAGVHRSTVTLALRDNRRISAEKRAEIRALAIQLGYRADPSIVALMKRRRSGGDKKPTPLAYVSLALDSFEQPTLKEADEEYFQGAFSRAAEVGWILERRILDLNLQGMSRFCDPLERHRVGAVLLGPIPPAAHSVSQIWERFPCVVIGGSLTGPKLHRVRSDRFANAALAVDCLVARGYQRIGLVISNEGQSLTPWNSESLGGFFARQQTLKKVNQLPVLLLLGEADPFNLFKGWIALWKPDALIAVQNAKICDWLKKLKLETPKDIGVAMLEEFDDKLSGIISNRKKIGAVGADMLIGAMHRQEVGLPVTAHETLVTGSWVQTRSVREPASHSERAVVAHESHSHWV